MTVAMISALSAFVDLCTVAEHVYGGRGHRCSQRVPSSECSFHRCGNSGIGCVIGMLIWDASRCNPESHSGMGGEATWLARPRRDGGICWSRAQSPRWPCRSSPPVLRPCGKIVVGWAGAEPRSHGTVDDWVRAGDSSRGASSRLAIGLCHGVIMDHGWWVRFGTMAR